MFDYVRAHVIGKRYKGILKSPQAHDYIIMLVYSIMAYNGIYQCVYILYESGM